MTTKQQSFVNAYLISGNATQAAIKAGYSKKTAYSQGQRMLKNVEIEKVIQQHKQRMSQETDISVIQVVKEIRQIALNGKSDHIRLRAYDMLMKHLGVYVSTKDIIENLTDTQLDKLTNELLAKVEIK